MSERQISAGTIFMTKVLQKPEILSSSVQLIIIKSELKTYPTHVQKVNLLVDSNKNRSENVIENSF